ncbi:acyl-CoA dehydrogenase [Myxococcota bacterium]|nr:acyl-CoA dehydrogenase [Myxococcota bacterium]
MSEYTAPLADMLFTLEHVADLPGLATLPGFEDADPEFVTGLLEEAGRFASEVLSPLNAVGDQQHSRLVDGGVVTPDGFARAYQAYTEAGWGAVGHPTQHGGAGLPQTVAVAVHEMGASANLAFSLCPTLSDGGIEALAQHGSPELCDTYLEPLVTGRITATMDLTEPQAGSDLAAIRTLATPQGDGSYRLSGQKIFITYGDHDLTDNIVHLVLARTPDAPAGSRGISLFLVPKQLAGPNGELGQRNDMNVVSLENKLGIHASPTCVMAYGENEGAVGYLVGEENQGLRQMFTMMNRERIIVGLQGLGVGERAYQAATEYARERRQGRALGLEASDGTASPIADHVDVRRTLLTMRAQTEAMRCLLYLSAAEMDRSFHHPDADERARAADAVALLTPITKAWLSDTGTQVASAAMQVHGGVGYVEETGVAQYLRDARITSIYEGTNGIQAMDLVLRKVAMGEGAVLRAHLAKLRDMQADADASGDELSDAARCLGDALDALDRAGDWLVQAIAREPRSAAAGATPFLEMLGSTTGGALLIHCATAAIKCRGADASTTFLDAKVATARFYAAQLLPRATALLPSIIAGAEPLDAIDPGDF